MGSRESRVVKSCTRKLSGSEGLAEACLLPEDKIRSAIVLSERSSIFGDRGLTGEGGLASHLNGGLRVSVKMILDHHTQNIECDVLGPGSCSALDYSAGPVIELKLCATL